MKSIWIISCRAQHVCDILNGLKTQELRTRIGIIKEGDEVHIYCTKDKETNRLIDFDKFAEVEKDNRFHYVDLKISSARLAFMPYLNGKVVAKFIVGKVERIDTHPLDNREQFPMSIVMSKWEKFNDILKKACLLADQLDEYSGYHKFKEKPVYALSITQLEIFDRPRELREYYTFKKKTVYSGMDCPPYVDEVKCQITRAPQSYMRAWVE